MHFWNIAGVFVTDAVNSVASDNMFERKTPERAGALRYRTQNRQEISPEEPLALIIHHDLTSLLMKDMIY